MQTISVRIFLILFIIVLINPSLLPAATEQRTALVIGNGAYSSGPLKNPVNDAADMAALLKRLGFSVTLKKNVGLQEMEEAIESFGNHLKRGGVGLFYYAGHGVQVNGTNYLLPIGAKINKEADVKYQSVDANKILDEMATANNGLNIVMLDACRDNPFGRSFRNASRGLAIVSSAPSGTFISYSTSPGNVARDGDGRNSPYTAALLKYLQFPGLSISDVFINVRAKVKKETGQVPWELSSLEGQFYFMPGTAKPLTDELGDENKKLEAEQRRLEEEKAAFAEKKAIDEKRQKIAEEKERLEAEKEVARQAALERTQAKKSTIFNSAENSPPKVGSPLPDFELPMLNNPAALQYLGLSAGGKFFRINQVKAKVVIIQIYSLYCPYCQAEAPNVNRLYAAIENSPALKDNVKIIGIGAGNTQFEVGTHKNKYAVAFPLVPDDDFKIHKKMGEVRTPYFIAVKLNSSGLTEVIYSRLGALGNVDQFLAQLVTLSGLK